MSKITLELLKKNNFDNFDRFEKYSINWFIRNKLIGMPFEVLKEVKGDYASHFRGLNSRLDKYHQTDWVYNKDVNLCKCKYDNSHNILYKEDPTNNILTYTYKYDSNNNCILMIDRRNVYYWKFEYEYDSNNNCIYSTSIWEVALDNNPKFLQCHTFPTEHINDNNGNCIHSLRGIDKVISNECTYEYYSDGQLKSITSKNENLYIPWFEKT